jgi:precorrin-2 methylase
MKSIFYPTKLILLFASLAILSCAKQQESYTQTISAVDGISNAELTYKQGDSTLVISSLSPSDLNYQRIQDGDVTVLVTDAKGTTTLNEVPSKYINLDAKVEVSRNVFQDYFPEEWAEMKGQQYTTIYIKSKKDDGVFYMKCVFTNTEKEIAKYSEDF